MTSMEDRIARVEGELAIRNLVAHYAVIMDDRDVDNIGRLFTKNARVWSGDGVMNTRGRDELVEFYKGRFAVLGATLHNVHGVVVMFESDTRARGIVSAGAEVWRNGVQQLAALRYEDIYEYEDGAWRIADRKMLYIYYCPLENYQGILGTLQRNLTYGRPIDADVPEKTEPFINYMKNHA